MNTVFNLYEDMPLKTTHCTFNTSLIIIQPLATWASSHFLLGPQQSLFAAIFKVIIMMVYTPVLL